MHMLYVTVQAQLCASRHICLCLPQWQLSGKEGRLNLPLRQGGRVQPLPCSKCAAFCHLKGASLAVNTDWQHMENKKNTVIYHETVRILKNNVIYIFGHTAQQ